MSQVPYRLCYAARPLNGIKILTSFFKTREHIQRKGHGPYFESQRQAHCNFSNVSRKSIQCLVSIKKGPNEEKAMIRYKSFNLSKFLIAQNIS